MNETCAWCGSDDVAAKLQLEGRGPWTPACEDCADREADNGWVLARGLERAR